MKNPPIRRRGFTLVELLVVVTIIIILAAAGFAAAMKALTKAKTVKAQTAVASLEQAINQFYNEYGRLPYPGDSPDTDDKEYKTSGEEGKKLIEILLGKEDISGGTTSKVQNPKQLGFLSVKEGSVKGTGGMDGIVYETGSTTSVRGLFDPWGRAYVIKMDNDYDEEIEMTTTGAPKMLRARRVVVYGYGPDGTTGNVKTAKDDVKNY